MSLIVKGGSTKLHSAQWSAIVLAAGGGDGAIGVGERAGTVGEHSLTTSARSHLHSHLQLQ